jgi:hypothetical protein
LELDGLLALHEVFHCGVEGVERPDVECGKGTCEGKNDEEDKRT